MKEKLTQELLKSPNNIYLIKMIEDKQDAIIVTHISGEFDECECVFQARKESDLSINDIVKIEGRFEDGKIQADAISIICQVKHSELKQFMRGREKIATRLTFRKEGAQWFLNIFNRQTNWFGIASEISDREALLFATKKGVENHNICGDKQNLAVTDVLVEKAQRVLTRRAETFLTFGVLAALIALSLPIILAFRILGNDILDGLPKGPASALNGFTFTLLLFRRISIGAVFIGPALFSAYFARAFFHEALGLFNKRHALRFGRMYVYLKKGHVDFKELEKAFQWNKDFATAFKDIRPELLSKSALNLIPETLKPIAEIVKSYNQKSGDKVPAVEKVSG